MLTQIGGKPESDFTQPLGMLSDCHKRIRYFLNSIAATVAQAGEGPFTSDQRIRLEIALRYFREAAPKHTADEEESLFPRMRLIRTAPVRDALARVEGIEKEHRHAEAQHDEVDTIVRQWIAESVIPEDDRRRLKAILSKLSNLYDRHIVVEETEIFPAAAAALTDAEKQALGHEMAARRGVEVGHSQPVSK